jgi:hypothetical protein
MLCSQIILFWGTGKSIVANLVAPLEVKNSILQPLRESWNRITKNILNTVKHLCMRMVRKRIDQLRFCTIEQHRKKKHLFVGLININLRDDNIK